MTDLATIKATFVDLRSVKTRSQTQLVFEIPIEHTDAALKALGGYPQPMEGKWVAIARLNESAAQKAPEPPRERKPAATLAEKMRRICGVPAFQFWLAVKNGCDEYGFSQLTKNEMYAQTLGWVKAACKISSTKEFDSDPDAEFHGKTLLAEYEQATGRMAERH